MWKRMWILAVLALVLGAAALGLESVLWQRQLAGGMIRLHVVAASDSREDQAMKLQVRNAVLPLAEQATRDCSTRAQARARLQAALPRLGEAALAAMGDRPMELTLSLGQEDFPTRQYDTFRLPAGPYESLRLTIGSGRGHNWWCVAFPALCLPATARGFEEAASAAGLSQADRDLLTGDTPAVELRFWLLDKLAELGLN